MSRISFDHTAMKIAAVMSERSTCFRRSVGAVLVDSHNRIISTGYNGVSSGSMHCNEFQVTGGERIYKHLCNGYNSLSGQNLDKCEAIHAEQNALMACHDMFAIVTCYVTVSPCMHCAKMLRNTSCKRIVFASEYSDAQIIKSYWESSGRIWELLKIL